MPAAFNLTFKVCGIYVLHFAKSCVENQEVCKNKLGNVHIIQCAVNSEKYNFE